MYWWRKYFGLIFGFVSVAAIILAVATKPKPHPSFEGATESGVSESNKGHSFMSTLAQKTDSPKEPKSAIEKFVQMESLKIGRPDPDPQKSYRKLFAVAHALGANDIEDLKLSALNEQLNNDQRFLSVYLLSLAKPSSALEKALYSIASEPISIADKSSRLYAEELMMRTQALEGLATLQPKTGEGPLHEYLRHQDNTFLISQAERLLREKQSSSGN